MLHWGQFLGGTIMSWKDAQDGPNMATPAQTPEKLRVSTRARILSQIFFVLMTLGIWLGIGLQPVWNGIGNLLLLAIGAYSTFRVFTGVRVTI
jgi:hypothetical protein